MATDVPLLHAGDRLTRIEFERRWEVVPELTRAELLEGVVYLPPPSVPYKFGVARFDLIGWLGLYRLHTAGVSGSVNASIRFDERNMPQPDILLHVLESRGGRCRVTPDDYLEGGPELIAEIANTTARYDLGVKREVYRRHGVQEYIVWRVADGALDWFVLRDGAFVPLAPGPDGVIRSEVFPGLWLDRTALLAGNAAALLRAAQEGHGSPEHGDFLRALQQRAAGVT